MEADEEKLITEADHHFVFIRPKAIVGSSGSVWASETIRLRNEQPDVFEVPHGLDFCSYSSAFRRLSARVQSAVFLFLDMTEPLDQNKIPVTPNKDCRHRAYELKRLQHLCKRVQTTLEASQELVGSESVLFCSVLGVQLQELTNRCSKYDLFLQRGEIEFSCEILNQHISPILEKGEEILTRIHELKLPPIKPRHADLTDAGPGVGVSNVEVKFREELARIHNNSDYQIRCHRSRGDSGQNEAERTNATIGDALVDGATIQWEHKKRFDGLSEEDIENMTIQQYEIHEKHRMEQNTWLVSQEITDRIHDAPVLKEYIVSFVSEKPEEQFF